MEKLIRITTVPISIEKLLENQPKYFSKFFFTSTKKIEGIIDIQKDIYTLSKKK